MCRYISHSRALIRLYTWRCYVISHDASMNVFDGYVSWKTPARLTSEAVFRGIRTQPYPGLSFDDTQAAMPHTVPFLMQILRIKLSEKSRVGMRYLRVPYRKIRIRTFREFRWRYAAVTCVCAAMRVWKFISISKNCKTLYNFLVFFFTVLTFIEFVVLLLL